MPIVHPQVQKARDLMPMLAAASAENDDIRKLTKPVVNALIDGGDATVLVDARTKDGTVAAFGGAAGIGGRAFRPRDLVDSRRTQPG